MANSDEIKTQVQAVADALKEDHPLRPTKYFLTRNRKTDEITIMRMPVERSRDIDQENFELWNRPYDKKEEAEAARKEWIQILAQLRGE